MAQLVQQPTPAQLGSVKGGRSQAIKVQGINFFFVFVVIVIRVF